ncbi:MAG: SusF/SusE family outer membrane protein [Bacteroides sp.]|nr:SusF/SusE family outer membrane protein [Bacteroides sp.]
MKRYIHLILPFLLLPLVSSCENDTDGPTLTEITPSVISSLPSGVFDLSSYDEENDNPLLFTLRWSPTEFHMKGNSAPQGVAPITYSIEIDRSGNNFADAATLAATTADTVDVFRKDLNDFLLSQLKLEAFETYELELRLSVKFGEGNHEFNQLYSGNTVTFSAIPVINEEEVFFIYLIGSMNGWNTSDKSFPMFRDDNKESNRIYTYTGRIAADTWFKFIPEFSLGTDDMYYDNGSGTLIHGDSGGGALYIEKEGYYTLTIDLQDMSWKIEPYDVSKATKWKIINFVGAFCNWGEPDDKNEVHDPEMEPSAYDPHIWTLEIDLPTIEYGVKFRADHSWDNKWCPRSSSEVPFGICDHNPSGDPNISLDETGTGTYLVIFNDLTGHYIISKK